VDRLQAGPSVTGAQKYWPAAAGHPGSRVRVTEQKPRIRAPSPAHARMRVVRQMLDPMTDDLGRLNQRVAAMGALKRRVQITGENRDDIPRQIGEAQTVLGSLAKQLDAALVGQPIEIVEHGRVKDVRATMAALRIRLAALAAD